MPASTRTGLGEMIEGQRLNVSAGLASVGTALFLVGLKIMGALGHRRAVGGGLARRLGRST